MVAADRDPRNDLLFQPRPVPEPDRRLGGYRLLHELGSGGMATLYLAIDEVGCLVAVKRLHPHLAAERRFLEMFEDEASLAARITHPHVCKVLGLEEQSGQVFMAMEYLHGESLAALLKQLEANGEQLPIEVALHLIGQACLGLHAAHEQHGDDGRPLQIVHRDISPQNLLVGYDGELKVVDFGIASAVARVHHTEIGTIKGKLCYMAPEQARGEPVDRRADIFGLGVVLYEAICGARCFPGNAAEVIRRVQALEIVPARQLRPELPPDVEAILARALQRSPTQRYATAEEMYREVYQCLARSPAPATTAGIGDLMRRVFARRFALREQLRSLAFAAPDVLEEEELTVDQPLPVALRCDYCGTAVVDDRALRAHLEVCGQRAWWEHNFGAREVAGAGDARALRERYTRAAAEVEESGGFWQRVRRRLLPGKKRDPLIVRLEAIDGRLGAVRDAGASQLASRATAALWGIVAELGEKGQAGTLLARIKPRVLTCAEVVLGVTLEIEANASFLAGASQERDLQQQIELLERRTSAATGVIVKELERSIRHKRALLAERGRLARRNELLLLRLESMVDAIELTLGKILQITASPALLVELEADTQITVFLDSMLVEVKRLGEALKEADEVLPRR